MSEEMKIYKGAQLPRDPVCTEAERAAQEYRTQQQNGNLKKAHELGEALARCFLEMKVEGDFAAQKWVLLSYYAQNLLEQLPGVLLQTSAQGKFNAALEEHSPELGKIIHDSRAYTLYVLNENRLRSRSEGEIFAELCERPEDRALVTAGEELTQCFAKKAGELIKNTEFVH